MDGVARELALAAVVYDAAALLGVDVGAVGGADVAGGEVAVVDAEWRRFDAEGAEAVEAGGAEVVAVAAAVEDTVVVLCVYVEVGQRCRRRRGGDYSAEVGVLCAVVDSPLCGRGGVAPAQRDAGGRCVVGGYAEGLVDGFVAYGCSDGET